MNIMSRIYIIICLLAIFMGFAPQNSYADSIFGTEGVFNDRKPAIPGKDGKIYLKGTKAWQENVKRQRDAYIEEEWQRRLPEIEAEYRRIYGPPLSERNKKR
jgi:hypothetical protein